VCYGRAHGQGDEAEAGGEAVVIFLAIALASAQQAPRFVVPTMPGLAADWECEMMRRVARDIGANLPMTFDATSRTESISVDCARRRVVWNNTGHVPATVTREAWRARKQSDWNASICRGSIWRDMQPRGWEFQQYQALPGGELIIFNAARCSRGGKQRDH
jgi:hypothetical protein